MKFLPGCKCCGVVANFTGFLIGCANAGIAGLTVYVKEPASGAVLATLTTGAGGAISGTLTLAGTSQTVVFATAGIDRFQDLAVTKTLGAGSNNVGNLVMIPASGYHCSGMCFYPLTDTLNINDQFLNKNFLMTIFNTNWNGATGTYLLPLGGSVLTVNGTCTGARISAASVTCPVVSTFMATYRLNTAAGSCPKGSTFVITEP